MGLAAGIERTRVIIPYTPRRQFEAYHYRKQRWACVVAHRRAGKTVACVNDLIKGALTCTKANPRFAYIAPLHVQAKDVAWGYVKQYSSAIPGVEMNESELRVDFPNGGRVRLYGAENYDRLRGLYLDGVILDEAADMDPRVWPEVIRPALSDRQGWATFIGTPKGRNAFFETFELAKNSPDWLDVMLKASETHIVPDIELADARTMMTPEAYAQEYECSFDAAIIGSYFGKEIAEAERAGRVGVLPPDPNAKVNTSWDLGMGDSTAIWFWQVAPDGVRIIDYYENNSQNLQHYVSELAARKYAYGDDWVPHDAKVREIGTGRTRVETLLSLGRKPRVVPDHKIMDGINAVRVSFPKIWIDADKCKFGLECLRQYRAEFDEKKKVFKDTPRHDFSSHAADSFRYLCMAWRALVPPKDTTPKPINTRMPTLNELVKHHERNKKYIGNRI